MIFCFEIKLCHFISKFFSLPMFKKTKNRFANIQIAKKITISETDSYSISPSLIIKCKIQRPLQVAEIEDHYLQMNMIKNNSEFGHNTNKICNVRACWWHEESCLHQFDNMWRWKPWVMVNMGIELGTQSIKSMSMKHLKRCWQWDNITLWIVKEIHTKVQRQKAK